jgi:hypothetical protein
MSTRSREREKISWACRSEACSFDVEVEHDAERAKWGGSDPTRQDEQE